MQTQLGPLNSLTFYPVGGLSAMLLGMQAEAAATGVRCVMRGRKARGPLRGGGRGREGKGGRGKVRLRLGRDPKAPHAVLSPRLNLSVAPPFLSMPPLPS